MEGMEKLDEVVSRIEEATDFEVIKEMKTILNKVFGEEYNQIIKPTVEGIKACFTPQYGLDESTLGDALLKLNVGDLQSLIRRCIPGILEYQIIIYFPEIVIKNGKNRHTIKDLYVKSLIRPKGLMVGSIMGVRSTFTMSEAVSNYVHSHLPAQTIPSVSFQPFCTGEGPIAQVISMLNNRFTIPNFMLFCLHLKNYVAWESKEGRPYAYMENIGKNISSGANLSLGDPLRRDAAQQIIREMKRYLNTKSLFQMLVCKVNTMNIEVTVTRAFELWAASRIRTWDPRRLLGSNNPVSLFLSHVDNSGRYYPVALEEMSTITYDREKVLLQFKGKDIKLKIENSHEKDNKSEETVPEEGITLHICEKLSHLLTEAAFSNARVKAGSPRTSESETPVTNTVHV